jgi:hypothetical protein
VLLSWRLVPCGGSLVRLPTLCGARPMSGESVSQYFDVA